MNLQKVEKELELKSILLNKHEVYDAITTIIGIEYIKFSKEALPELLKRVAVKLFILENVLSPEAIIIRKALIQLEKFGYFQWL